MPKLLLNYVLHQEELDLAATFCTTPSCGLKKRIKQASKVFFEKIPEES
jgi:hypothetical protein